MNHPAASASFSANIPAFDAPMPIPVREVLPWAIFIGLLALLAIYFVGAEQGATSIFQGMYIHEFVHDGRHLLGFPCH
ncbi:CbtB domain-containing protein [Caballeronia sp. KNU42]